MGGRTGGEEDHGDEDALSWGEGIGELECNRGKQSVASKTEVDAGCRSGLCELASHRVGHGANVVHVECGAQADEWCPPNEQGD